MAFPTTPVLDDFNRADAADLGPNWTDMHNTGDDTAVLSGRAHPTTGTDSQWWNQLIAADLEIYITLVTVSASHWLDWRALNPTRDGDPDPNVAGIWSGYQLFISSSGSQISVRKWTGSALEAIGGVVSQSFTNFDQVGVRHVDDLIEVFLNGALLFTRTNNDYPEAGRHIVEANGDWDDFGGGDLAVSPTTNEAKLRQGITPLRWR